MPSLGRRWCRIRRLKRLTCLLLLVSLLIYLMQFADKMVEPLLLSDSILNSLHEKVTHSGNTVGMANNNACTEYFNSLFSKNSDWSIRNFTDKRKSLFSERHIINSVRYLRIYGHCFVRVSNPTDELDIGEVERRLFPAFTQKLPIFYRWDGVSLEEFPVLGKHSSTKKAVLGETAASSAAFWYRMKENFNGRGIVISMGMSGVDEVKRLMKVLRVLQNTLPIQIVHKGDISASSINEVVDAGRGHLNIDGKDQPYESQYPQDIWFVNAGRSLKSESLDLFNRFSNKWVASLFNSFEEMILMDTDAVPFIKPETLFDAQQYKETGAYFFKDRPIGEFLKSSDLKFFKKLLPLEKEYSTFDIPRLTGLTFENDFMKSSYKHLMESGIVIMKRSSHLPGLLISATMQLWKEVSEPIYGDKELFWLGQSISGNEEYRFNKNAAGAIGIFNKDERSNADYICSTQIAHFSEDLQLLWTNGGLRNCKKGTSQIDFDKNKFLRQKYRSVTDLKNYYESPIEVNGAILTHRQKLSILQRLSGARSGYQKCSKMGCIGYVWCAYYHSDNKDNIAMHFTDGEIDKINSLIKIWTAV